ncbi:MAG: ATP-binding cassette domain-containing protein, partial [Clostridia bacterium]
MAILEVKNLKKNFGATEVLKGITFSMEKGEVLAIIGSSGSGKTTLLRCLNFLETADKGQIVVSGETLFDADKSAKEESNDIRKKRLHFGLVFQSFNLFPHFNVLRNITIASELIAKENLKKECKRIDKD